jgi:septum formation protein
LKTPPIILASASPRRTELLRRWGVAHEVIPPRGEEAHDERSPIERLTRELAEQKAAEVASRLDGTPYSDRIVLAADTLVGLDGRLLGKPRDAAAAKDMLASLSGRAVLVASAVCVTTRAMGEAICGCERSIVRMRRFDARAIEEYVASGEPLDKAGAFAVQGIGRRLIAGIEGSVSNVIGLPRALVFELLPRAGWDGDASGGGGDDAWETS